MFDRASIRWSAATFLCFFWICTLVLDVPPGLATVYSWRDDQGRLHFTDNPATIPPRLRPQSRVLPLELPPGISAEAQGDETPSPSSVQAAPPSQSATRPPEGPVLHLKRRASDLQQQIEAAKQERQRYLDKITSFRDIRTNPAFGRERRRVDEWGRELAAVEHHLDLLRQDLEDVQRTLQKLEEARQPARRTTPSPEDVVVDAEGHTRDYWQDRAQTLRTQLQQAREQRQHILEQLMAKPTRAFGRRGEEVLRLARTLEQTEATIRDTETALQKLRQEARAAGAPSAWLE